MLSKAMSSRHLVEVLTRLGHALATGVTPSRSSPVRLGVVLVLVVSIAAAASVIPPSVGAATIAYAPNFDPTVLVSPLPIAASPDFNPRAPPFVVPNDPSEYQTAKMAI